MYKQLISEQRYTIFILLQNGTKKKDIAKAINVSPSTVSREIKRNSGRNGHYNWATAQRNDFHPAAFATILGISVLSIRP